MGGYEYIMNKTTTKTNEIFIKPEKGWAIYGHFGFYYDFRPSKKEIITRHCADLGKSWYMCKKHGDRAIRIEIRAL